MSIFDLIKNALTPSADTAQTPPAVAEAFDSIKKLKALFGEQRRLSQMARDQIALGEALDRDIADLAARRIELMADAMVDRENNTADQVAELAEKIAEKLARRDDVDKLAASLRQRAAAMDEQLPDLKFNYLRDLGLFLGSMGSSLVDDYNAKAGELADIMMQMGAVHDVMMLYRTGNTGGLDVNFLIPRMVAGDARTQDPILDPFSVVYRLSRERFKDQITAKLVEAGFVHRFN